MYLRYRKQKYRYHKKNYINVNFKKSGKGNQSYRPNTLILDIIMSKNACMT